MWLARHYQEDKTLYLFTHQPVPVSEEHNRFYYDDKTRFYKAFDSRYGKIPLSPEFNEVFESFPQPIEVSLVPCSRKDAMFWVQRHKDSVGQIHLYIDQKLTTSLWLSGRKTIEVDTYHGYRLPQSTFPELTIEKGYMPIKLIPKEGF